MEKVIDLFELYPLEYDFTGIFLLLSILSTIFILIGIAVKFKLGFDFTILLKEKKKPVRINLKNPKETAYNITFLIHQFSTPYNSKLLKKLERYKYRKEVENLDSETKELIMQFIEYVRRNYGGI